MLLGSGALDYEEAFQAAAAAYPDNVRAHVGFSVPLSHRILAASDILLMPSRFEPCGLNQLYAMRYGTIPVAHGTGGLRDTIDEVKPFLGEKPIRTAAEDLDELFTTGTARTVCCSEDGLKSTACGSIFSWGRTHALYPTGFLRHGQTTHLSRPPPVSEDLTFPRLSAICPSCVGCHPGLELRLLISILPCPRCLLRPLSCFWTICSQILFPPEGFRFTCT